MAPLHQHRRPVEDAIRQAPSRVVLGNRRGERRVFLEGNKYWFGPSLDCIDYMDPATHERQRFTSEHVKATAALCDALPNFQWCMTIGMADDVPADIADRVIAKQVFTYTEKALVFCCKDANSVRDIYEMALLIAGSEGRFYQAPTIVHYSEPISPLQYYDPAVDKILYCADKGIPLINFPAPQGGSTAPATFAGEIVQGSAESLSGLVLAQLVRPGRDPREDLPPPTFRREVMKLDDIRPEMELSGTVLNVVDFGAFVDIGLRHCAQGRPEAVEIVHAAARVVVAGHDVEIDPDHVEHEHQQESQQGASRPGRAGNREGGRRRRSGCATG